MNVVVNDGNTGTNTNRRMTITINDPTTERYYFTVRTANDVTTAMYLQSPYFNRTATLN